MNTKDKIPFSEFLEIEKKLEIKIGRILEAESVPKSYGIKLTVDFGNDDVRTVFTNLGKTHKPEEFIGLSTPFVTNLTPTEIKGVLSQAMILAPQNLNGDIEWYDYSVGTKLL
jgi:methionyl-tRNA synthetase